MNIGIVTVRDETFHPTRRLAEAAGQRGHRVALIHPYRRWPVIAGGTPAIVGGESGDKPDVVLPRQGAQIGRSCMVLISHLRLMGIPLVNGPDAIRLASNQFLTLQALAAAGIPVPDTLFINATEGRHKVGDYAGGYPVVVKEINGHQGAGVSLAKNEAELNRIVQTNLHATQGMLLQKFISTTGRSDIRALVIGGRVAGAMLLRPPADDFRANFHLGANAAARTLTDSEAGVAVGAARAVGLDIAGVDLVADAEGRVSVIEVNYSPGFKGLELATGIDIAGLMVDYAAAVAGHDVMQK